MLEMSTSSTGEVQEALQRVTADLEEANRELHDLREVKPLGGTLIKQLSIFSVAHTNILCVLLDQECHCQYPTNRLAHAICYRLPSMLDTT